MHMSCVFHDRLDCGVLVKVIAELDGDPADRESVSGDMKVSVLAGACLLEEPAMTQGEADRILDKALARFGIEGDIEEEKE